MGMFMMLARKMQLLDRKNNLEYQITALNAKKEDYIRYTSILSQDTITIDDIASLPSSLFAQGLTELTQTHNTAMQMAQNNYAQAVSTGMFGDGENTYLQQLTMQKMYEDARRQVQKRLQATLNELEKSATANATRLQVQLTNTEKELEQVDERLGKNAQNAACSYGLRA